jgi:hypothetical protein
MYVGIIDLESKSDEVVLMFVSTASFLTRSRIDGIDEKSYFVLTGREVVFCTLCIIEVVLTSS